MNRQKPVGFYKDRITGKTRPVFQKTRHGFHDLIPAQEKKVLDSISGMTIIDGVKYNYKVFHPLAFENGAYTVSISKLHPERPYSLDRDTIYFSMVSANDSRDALKKALEEVNHNKGKYIR